MFENLRTDVPENPAKSQVVKPENKAVEDILSGVNAYWNQEGKPPVLRPAKESPVAPPEPSAPRHKFSRYFMFAAIVLAFVLLFVGGWFVYNTVIPYFEEVWAGKNNQVIQFFPETKNNGAPEENTTSSAKTQEEIIREQEENSDSDQDGLSDYDEKIIYFTDPNLSDTDHDGLSDYDEVKKYFTNPLSPDTDGDGYLDGVEVKSGYDPKGPGRL